MDFQVVSELDDNSDPWTRLSYYAESEEDTCRTEADSPSCDQQKWWVRVRMRDEESGLNRVAFYGAGPNANHYPIYYR